MRVNFIPNTSQGPSETKRLMISILRKKVKKKARPCCNFPPNNFYFYLAIFCLRFKCMALLCHYTKLTKSTDEVFYESVAIKDLENFASLQVCF